MPVTKVIEVIGTSSVGSDDAVREALAARQAAGDDRKTAIATVTRELDLPRRRVYELAHRPAASPTASGAAPPAGTPGARERPPVV